MTLRSRLVLLAFLGAGSCTESNPGFTLGDGGGRRDRGPRADAVLEWGAGEGGIADGARFDIFPSKPTGVDILFVVDNTSGMGYPQQWLARDLDAILGPLEKVATGANYRIGVTTTDMGVGSYKNNVCTAEGDGGKLLVPGACAKPLSGARYLQRQGSTNNVAGSLRDALACYITSIGTTGCGFEQPLKAMRAALDSANKGFLRNEAALAVVILTNEDDCSATTNSLFNSQDTTLGPYSSYRCFQHGVLCNGTAPPLQATLLSSCKPGQSWLKDVKAEYGDFLKALKPKGWVSALVLSGPTASTVEVEEHTQRGQTVYTLKSACYNSGYVQADPTFRLDLFVAQLGTYGVFAQICESSYKPALQSLALRIQSAF